MPVSVTRLMQVTSNPDCSVKDVVETIHFDQSLCLTVLKIANSVLFGRPQKVDSIKMAVIVLGFNEVQRIALTKAFINSFNKLARRHKTYIDRFWEHCFVCGMVAQIIARDLQQRPDLAFMGGLLHDIGKLIMLETFTDDYAPELWMNRLSTRKTLHEELQMFSFTHDMLGGQLLRKWLFPDNIIAAVAYHHRPWEAAREKGFALVVQLADFLSFYCCNRELLEGDDIFAATEKYLPEVLAEGRDLGLPVGNAAITGWFSWLLNNHKQGSRLKEAFAS